MTSQPIRGLLVEQNPIDVDLIEIALTESNTDYRVFHVDSINSASAILETWDCDFVLLSLDDDDISTKSVAELLSQSHAQAVIGMTAKLDDNRDELFVEAGLQDVVQKGDIGDEFVLVEELDRSIRHAVARQSALSHTQRIARKERKKRRQSRKQRLQLKRKYQTAHRFVDDVSHEFRTPLAVIKEYSSLLNEGLLGELNADQSEFLAIINDRADDLNAMVNDMLDVSKLESGVLGLARTKTTIPKVLARCWQSLVRKSDVRGVSICQFVDDDLPEVFCDPEKISRVVTNLATNAIKFCREPGQVRIWARYEPTTGDVRIGVTDNGPGIDQNQQLVLFERFQQLGAGIQCEVKGFGLGLSIANELVDLNFGRIDVNSTPGEGSTFSFTVPVYDEREVTRRYLQRLQRTLSTATPISLVLLETDTEHDTATYDELHDFLARYLKRDDLAFRFRDDYWLLVLPMEEPETVAFLADLDYRLDETNRNRPEGELPFLQATNIGNWRLGESDDIANCVECTTLTFQRVENGEKCIYAAD